MKKLRPQPRPGSATGSRLRRWLVSAAVIFGLSWLLVTFTPVLRWWMAPLCQPWDDARGDTLVVLASGANPDGTVNYPSYHRALHAAWLYREHRFHDIFVTGVTAAPAIRNFLVGAGVPPDRIRIEASARNTRENALFAAAALKSTPGRKVLLTSDYHTYRAFRVFKKAGFELRTAPAPDAGKRVNGWLERWNVFIDLCIESAKIGVYRVRGWM